MFNGTYLHQSVSVLQLHKAFISHQGFWNWYCRVPTWEKSISRIQNCSLLYFPPTPKAEQSCVLEEKDRNSKRTAFLKPTLCPIALPCPTVTKPATSRLCLISSWGSWQYQIVSFFSPMKRKTNGKNKNEQKKQWNDTCKWIENNTKTKISWSFFLPQN